MILATVSLCLLFVAACSRQEGRLRPCRAAPVAAVEDSRGAKSPQARQMILKAMAEAPDSIAYYECYVRMARCTVFLPLPLHGTLSEARQLTLPRDNPHRRGATLCWLMLIIARLSTLTSKKTPTR